MKKLRIAYFAGTMKPGQDGVTRVLFRLVDWLNKKEIENLFISAIIPNEEEQSTSFLKVPSIVFPLYREYKFALPGYKNFQNALFKFNPDILHINSPCSLGCAAIKYSEKWHLPVVATYHTHFPSYAKYYKISQLESLSWGYLKHLYNRCDKVFVPSLTIMTELKDHGFKTTGYLPHGVDTEIFNPSFKSNEWKESLGLANKKVLLYVGRLVWEKDLKTLVEIYKALMTQRNDTAFVIAGDGPIRNELEQMMPDAKFLGYQSGKDLSTIFASSDLFVFPSTTETFGNVILESMASGLPAVCAREGGAYSSIENNFNGLICEPRDVADFSEKINSLLDNETARLNMSLNCTAYAKSQSWDNIFTKLYENYLEIYFNYYKREKREIAA